METMKYSPEVKDPSRSINERFATSLRDFARAHPYLIEDGTIEMLKGAIQHHPIPETLRAYEIDSWVSALVDAGEVLPENANKYLDIVASVFDHMDAAQSGIDLRERSDESAPIESVEPRIEESPQTALQKKMLTKMRQYASESIGPRQQVDLLIHMLEQHPIEFEQEYRLETWLGEREKAGDIPPSEYYRYLDILTSEIL